MDVSGKIRRLLADTNSGLYVYNDDMIFSSIKDSCHELMGIYRQKFETQNGISLTPVPTNKEESIIALQAVICINEAEATKASRDGIKYRDSAHSLDNTSRAVELSNRNDSLKQRLAQLIKTEHSLHITPKRGEFADRDGNTSTSAATFNSSNEVVPPRV